MDLRAWVPDDDLSHFVIESVERVDIGAFKVNWRGSGKAQYHPRMMLAPIVYCHANGIFLSRRIERARYRDVGVRYPSGDTHPDHDTIAAFRRANAEAFSAAARLEAEARARAAAEQPEYEARQRAHAARNGQGRPSLAWSTAIARANKAGPNCCST